MEFTPNELNSTQLLKDLLSVDGIDKCTDFHVWAIKGGKNCMSAHLTLKNSADDKNFNSLNSKDLERQSMIRRKIDKIVHKYEICHSTI